MLDFEILKLDITCDIEEIREYYETVVRDFDHLRWCPGDAEIEAGYGTLGHRVSGVFGWAIDHNGPDLHVPCPPYNIDERKFDFYRETDLNFGFIKKLKRAFPFAHGFSLATHPPGSYLNYHIDQAEFIKVHIPIYTNDDAMFFYRGSEYNLKADGSIYLVNTMIEHGTDNRGATNRAHLLFKVDNTMSDVIKSFRGYL